MEKEIKKRKGNKFVIEGEIVKMELKRRGKESLWTIFDLEDLDKVKDFPYTWISHYNRTNDAYYATTTCNTPYNGRTTIQLHMFVMDFFDNRGKKIHIDHINRDTLDNRKSNLRMLEAKENLKNRNGKNSNNTSGYRNVTRDKNKWIVQLQVNGKNKRLGSFDDVDAAGEFAEKMREKYYGKYKGVS